MFWEALLPYRGLTGRSALQMPFSLCLSRKKRLPRPRHAQNPNAKGGVSPWDSPTFFPLPVGEKAILDNTPNKRACDGHFPLPVKGKAIPSHRALRSPTEPFRALRSPMCTPATEPCGVPRKSFSSTGRGKSESQAPHDCLFRDRQGEKGLARTRHVPMITVSSTGRGERESQAHAMFP